MAIAEPEAANDDTAGTAEASAPAQQPAPYVDCLTPLLDAGGPRAPACETCTSTPTKVDRAAVIAPRNIGKPPACDLNRGLLRKLAEALGEWMRRRVS